MLLILVSACREGVSMVYNPEDEGYRIGITRTLSEQFNYLWKGINNSYVFWSDDPLNWDSIYRVVLPQFEELDYKAQRVKYIGNEEIQCLMEASFGKLIDRHLTVGIINPYAKEGETRNVMVQPGMKEIQSRPDYHKDNVYKLKLTEEEYLLIDDTYLLLSPSSSAKYDVSQFLHAQETTEAGIWYAYSCLLDGCIPYLKMSNFYISDSEHTSEMNNLLQNFFSNVRNLSKKGTLKGVILDNRGNMGGLTNDLNFFPGMFIDKPMTVMRRRTKSGLGRYDYEGWTDVVVQSSKVYQNIPDFNVPFVVLQDMYTISLGEIVSYAVSKLPNGHIIGENTMGAFGTLLTTFDVYHAGSFNYARAETEPFVYCSTYQGSAYNDVTERWECMEGGGGFAPDEYVALDTLSLKNHICDNQLDAALKFLR